MEFAKIHHVGVVGLGKMGSAMALNLLTRGYGVAVWNRSPEPIGALVERGATRASSLTALCEAVDAVIVSLWGDDAAREVTLAQIIPAVRATELVIEMSTLSPAMYEMVEKAALEHGLGFLAAPVLGSVDLARQGSLTILAGGRQTTFERARPLLEALGTTVTYTGSVKASGYLKLANNTIIGVVAVTLSELLAFCERGEVDRRLAVESLTGAFGRIASSKTQQLLQRDSDPRFSLNALLKDVLLAREAAQSAHVPMPIFGCVLPRIQDAASRGLGDRDYIAVALEAAR